MEGLSWVLHAKQTEIWIIFSFKINRIYLKYLLESLFSLLFWIFAYIALVLRFKNITWSPFFFF